MKFIYSSFGHRMESIIRDVYRKWDVFAEEPSQLNCSPV